MSALENKPKSEVDDDDVIFVSSNTIEAPKKEEADHKIEIEKDPPAPSLPTQPPAITADTTADPVPLTQQASVASENTPPSRRGFADMTRLHAAAHGLPPRPPPRPPSGGRPTYWSSLHAGERPNYGGHRRRSIRGSRAHAAEIWMHPPTAAATTAAQNEQQQQQNQQQQHQQPQSQQPHQQQLQTRTATIVYTGLSADEVETCVGATEMWLRVVVDPTPGGTVTVTRDSRGVFGIEVKSEIATLVRRGL